MKHPYHADGLDYQGRHPERVPAPAADSAEGAAGSDDKDAAEQFDPHHNDWAFMCVIVGALLIDAAAIAWMLSK